MQDGINVQGGINVQDGKLPKINKRVGWPIYPKFIYVQRNSS